MRVTLPIEISDETLAYVIEGADIGYWGEYSDYVDAAEILAGNGVAVIWERGDDEGKDPLDGTTYLRLEPASIERGLQLMAQHYPRHFRDIMCENYDCATGDVLVQLALLGELKYG